MGLSLGVLPYPPTQSRIGLSTRGGAHLKAISNALASIEERVRQLQSGGHFVPSTTQQALAATAAADAATDAYYVRAAAATPALSPAAPQTTIITLPASSSPVSAAVSAACAAVSAAVSAATGAPREPLLSEPPLCVDAVAPPTASDTVGTAAAASSSASASTAVDSEEGADSSASEQRAGAACHGDRVAGCCGTSGGSRAHDRTAADGGANIVRRDGAAAARRDDPESAGDGSAGEGAGGRPVRSPIPGSPLVLDAGVRPAERQPQAELECLEGESRLLRQHLDAMIDIQTCKVCLDGPIGGVLVPCGHLALCVECASRMLSGSACPFCRQPAISFALTFDA